jgi:hypothetical protein
LVAAPLVFEPPEALEAPVEEVLRRVEEVFLAMLGSV